MNEELANQNRIRSIKEIVERRGIETLCHFTRVENLSSILRLGLWGRNQLERIGTSFLRIDPNRFDGHRDAVCLTVSFPNYKLFYKKREEHFNLFGVEHNQWVVLLLEANLLWELDCAFCSYNASANTVSRISLEERKKPEAFEAMFGNLKTVSRMGFPPHFTSSPQAEVLVFDAVPISYVKEVHFYDYQGWENWYSNDYTASNVSFDYGRRYFETRKIQ